IFLLLIYREIKKNLMVTQSINGKVDGIEVDVQLTKDGVFFYIILLTCLLIPTVRALLNCLLTENYKD
ncbi:MAG: hypothetical protein MRQ09_04665, partial [Candidatus Midichloria sp.]|nr:hypothetical protein [Candidatus Midichloria sp.]